MRGKQKLEIAEKSYRGREDFVPGSKVNYAVAVGDEILPFYRTPPGKNWPRRLSYWSGVCSSCGQSPYAFNNEVSSQMKKELEGRGAFRGATFRVDCLMVPAGSEGNAVETGKEKC